ncbi:MAG: ferrous iron transporter B [Halieaceae bacterium]|jgi:ferrous iron transport protein B|nr:ferrous iron transporter B [Halieaceae bacterium]
MNKALSMEQSVLLIGSPNCGKTLLFNRLTGLSHKVANFPGITVEIARGAFVGRDGVALYDYPGTYSLEAISGEEQVAVDQFSAALADPGLGLALCVIDVTRLEKSLYFALQVVRECRLANKPVIVLANLMDVLEAHRLSIDLDALGEDLGAPVLGISARTGSGLDALNERVTQALDDPPKPPEVEAQPNLLLRGTAHQLAHKYGPKGDVLLRTQNRLDSFFLHSTFGGIAFFLVMYLLFQSIFTWAAPAMDSVEAGLGWLSDRVVPLLGPQLLQDFAADAVFSGLGAFLVFVPQIFVLTFVIGLLEDSGYMARAALICHRPLRAFGLTGKSFIPMLSGVACAIPGIYAARSIESPRRRFLTYLAIPLMPCSARLPVYTLLIAAFIPSTTIGGVFGWQGLAMFLVYFFGMSVGLLVTATVSRSSRLAENDLPFVLEMPAYRRPAMLPLLRKCWQRCGMFITKAGPIILSVTLLVWVLGYFPNGGENLGESWLGQLGVIIEPVFAPLDLDWRYGVAILTSFLAREVFVGTLGVMFGIEGADENMVPLVDQIQASGLGVASGVALLVFFAVALMCVSTLAVLSRESGSAGLAAKLFAAYVGMAYVMSLLAFQIVSIFVP